MQSQDQIQQGDVLLRRIKSLPKDVAEVKRKNGFIVLAEGELTGHAHRISDVDAMFYEKDGMFFLKTKKAVTLTHEEHGPHIIEPGIWEVGQVREKDWLSDMVRTVVD